MPFQKAFRFEIRTWQQPSTGATVSIDGTTAPSGDQPEASPSNEPLTITSEAAPGWQSPAARTGARQRVRRRVFGVIGIPSKAVRGLVRW